MYFILIFIIAGLGAAILYPLALPRLMRARIVGRDVNKPRRPRRPEMGGIVIAAAFSLGMVVAIAIHNTVGPWKHVNSQLLLAALCSVLAIAIAGIFDDLKQVWRPWKLMIPVVGALPLAAVMAGVTYVILPFVGRVDFGIWYPLVIVPIGMVGAANAANMLAGFNGLEAGLGILSMSALAVITYTHEFYTPFLVLICMIGPLLVTLRYNWYPARIFIGNVGTHSIGAVLCAAAVLGNCETAGVIVMIPHGLDIVIKLTKGLPSTGWWGEHEDGKLYCPRHGPVGLCQLIMKLMGGVREPVLVLILLGMELLCAGAAVALYARF